MLKGLIINIHTLTGDDQVDIACDVTEGIPVSDNSFDCVYSSHLIEDFEDTESILKEFIRILSTQGVLALVVPNEKEYKNTVLRITINITQTIKLMIWMQIFCIKT